MCCFRSTRRHFNTSLAIAGVARRRQAADRDPEIELPAGDGERHRAHAQVAFNKQRNADIQKLAAEAPTHNSRRRTTRINTRRRWRSSTRPRLRSRAPSSRWIPRSAASTPRSRSFRRNLKTRAGIIADDDSCARDGFVTLVALSVGDRALQARSAMSFIVENEITLVGMFSQNGFQTIKEGAPVDIVFDNAPGRIYRAKVTQLRRASARDRSPCRNARAHQCARRCDGVSGGDLDPDG